MTSAAVDAAIDTAIAENRIVGTVVMVARDGETVHARAAGLADREAGVPVADDTVFRFASLTKPIVAATALAMVERGLVALDTPVADILGDFRPALPDGETPAITVHHLLTHTAGLDYAGDDYRAAGVVAGLLSSEITLEENLKRIASVPLRFPPGTVWHYSVATDVLGGLLARVHGGTLGDAVAHYVTGPLGMTDTRFGVADPSRLAVAYADGDPIPVPMDDPHFLPNEGDGIRFSPGRIFDPGQFHSGGAGMAGTAADFLTFLEALRDGGGRILAPETIALATNNRIGDAPRREGDAGKRFGYFGAVVDDPVAAGSLQARGSYEWGGIYGNSWFVDPANRLSVVILTNTAFEGCNGRFPDEVRDAVYAQA